MLKMSKFSDISSISIAQAAIEVTNTDLKNDCDKWISEKPPSKPF
jgi:hypothetical protein